MSDNLTPTLIWWVDEEHVAVVAVARPTDIRRTRLNVSYFETERGAWDALGAQVTARVIETGRVVANAETALAAAADHRRHGLAEATLYDWQCLAAAAARNYALYQERRQAWNRQVDQALAVPQPEPAPPTFQRGDVVEVTLWDITYRGLVTATRRGRAYVATRRSGHWHDPDITVMQIVERRGRRNAATLHEWAQAFE
ncbi:MAG TPA: hypothetical protein PKH77_19900 [Anaerolineae bacterium]|nr:hypothetical protein [Anaerolineae bacterium]